MAGLQESAAARAARLVAEGRGAEALPLAREALFGAPGEADMWTLFGVAQLQAGDRARAALAFERAARFAPGNPAPLINLVRLRLSLGETAAALEAATRLVETTPDSVEAHRLAATAAAAAGDVDGVIAGLRRVASLEPGAPQAWLDLAAHLTQAGRVFEASLAVQEGLAANPGDARLAEIGVRLALQRLSEGDATGQWPAGRSEGDELQAAYDALIAALEAGVPADSFGWLALSVLQHVAAFDDSERVGDFQAQGRRWAETGGRQGFLIQLPRVGPAREGRLELLHQHRLWAERVEAEAARTPISVPAAKRSGKVRIGILSADFDEAVVVSFIRPLFDHLDQDHCELYAYSMSQGSLVQEGLAKRATVHRPCAGAANAAEVATVIAKDGLDILMEVGGPTGGNRPEIMAYRMAPVQVSWLGYPHSLGFSTIDRILLDPFLVPPDPGLLFERPLIMPKTWIALDDAFFDQAPAVDPADADGRGSIVFGTANAAYKYTRACVDAWARVVAEVPDSSFMVLRPEAGSRTFQENITRAFAARGVAPERIRFEPLRGRHLPLYREMDISLDTFPLTGGITTCESLLMGIPVVSLVGEAVFERLSHSILNNVGLSDLATPDVDAFVSAAAGLAADRGRLKALRAGLRDQMRASPLGQAEAFARDFYALMRQTAEAARAG